MSDEEAENQSENAENAESAEGEGKGKNKKKLILFIAAPVLLLILAGGGLYFSGILGGGDKAAQEEGAHGEAAGEEDHAAAEEDGGGHGGGHGGGGHGAAKASNFIEIPPMIVNLNTDDGTPRYLRLTVQLELEKSSDRDAVEAIIPRVIDQFQTYLRELRVKDLRGSSGVYRLQMEMLWRVNQAAAPVKVKDVLLQEILIQ